jgi:hypothetical protein
MFSDGVTHSGSLVITSTTFIELCRFAESAMAFSFSSLAAVVLLVRFLGRAQPMPSRRGRYFFKFCGLDPTFGELFASMVKTKVLSSKMRKKALHTRQLQKSFVPPIEGTLFADINF